MDSQQTSQFVQYLPVLILLCAAIGFAVSVLGLSLLLGKFAGFCLGAILALGATDPRTDPAATALFCGYTPSAWAKWECACN